MKNLLCAAALAALVTSPVAAQLPAAPAQSATMTLPANTEVIVALNDELNSARIREGQTFSATVQQDVFLGSYIVIPRGTRAVGEVTWKTGKAAFGKSGKMEVAMRYLELAGQRVPIDGTLRHEGEGRTGATIGAVVAAGVLAGLFVTGKSAVMPQGREFSVHTRDPLPVLVANAPQQAKAAGPILASAYAPPPPLLAAPTLAATGTSVAVASPAAAPVIVVAEDMPSFRRGPGESCRDYSFRVAGSLRARAAFEAKCEDSE